MPRSHLSQWSGEKNCSRFVGLRNMITLHWYLTIDAVTLISRNTVIFNSLNIYKSVNRRLIIEGWATVWFLRSTDYINNFAVAEYSPVAAWAFHKFIDKRVPIEGRCRYHLARRTKNSRPTKNRGRYRQIQRLINCR